MLWFHQVSAVFALEKLVMANAAPGRRSRDMSQIVFVLLHLPNHHTICTVKSVSVFCVISLTEKKWNYSSQSHLHFEESATKSTCFNDNCPLLIIIACRDFASTPLLHTTWDHGLLLLYLLAALRLHETLCEFCRMKHYQPPLSLFTQQMHMGVNLCVCVFVCTRTFACMRACVLSYVNATLFSAPLCSLVSGKPVSAEF